MILVPLVTLLTLYVVAAVVALAFGPRSQFATLPFRLEFEGAGVGLYPNEMPFSPSEIVSTPILQAVYDANDLDRFVEFALFSSSVFVVEWNPTLDELEREYRSRMDDPKISPIERERFEREFAQKVSTLDRSGYSLNLDLKGNGARIPRLLTEKVLRDILDTWASYAREKKGVMRYQAHLLTPKILTPTLIEGRDPLIAADVLRTRALEIQANVRSLARIPGAQVVRAEQSEMNLGELALRTQDLIRFDLQPITSRLLADGIAVDPDKVEEYFESQIEFTRLALRDARAKVAKRERMLELYTSRTVAPDAEAGSGGPSTVPQLSEGFVDRIVSLTRAAENQEFRLEMVAEIQEAALELVPLESEVEYYEKMLQDVRSTSWRSRVDDELLDSYQVQFAEALESLVSLGEELDSIYRTASENLNSARELFTEVAPASVVSQRRYTLFTVLSVGFVMFLLAVPALVILAVIRHRLVIERMIDGGRASR